jgi:hypothetical protein
MSWSDNYFLFTERVQASLQEDKGKKEREMITKFNDKFYPVCFEDLQEQRSGVYTDDGGHHFISKEEPKLHYTWYFNQREWGESKMATEYIQKLLF